MTKKPNRKLQTHTLLLIGIIVLATLLRCAQPALVEFKRDEATVARLGQAIAYEDYLPAVGVDSSQGIDNLPFTLYLMALPLRLWSDPLAAVIFTCLLNTLAVGGCYLLGRACLDKKAALIATYLFAVGPWAVLYARKIWCRTLPLFSIALMLSLFATFVKGKRWALVGVFVSLAVLVGLQLEGIAFIPIVGLAMVLYRDKLEWKPLLLGVGLCALLCAPYIIHDALNGWKNTQGLLNYSSGSGTFSWDALKFALMITGSAGIEGQVGSYHTVFKNSGLDLWWLNSLGMAMTAAALLYGLGRAIWSKTQKQRRTFTLLMLWFAVPVLLQLRPSSATQFHYFVTHYPVQYLLVAAMLVEGLNLLPRVVLKIEKLKFNVASSALILALLIWGGWQTSVTLNLRRYMVEHPTSGGYGIPLRYTRDVAHQAKELAGEAEIIVVGKSTEPYSTETPTVFDALLFGHPHRFTDGRAALPVPQGERVVYIIGPLQDEPPALWQATLARMETLEAFETGPRVQLPDGWHYRIYLHQAENRASVIAGMTPLAEGIAFANKAVFAAYKAPESLAAGESIEVWLAWWLQGPPPSGIDYHFTVQLLDAEGRPQAQDDHAAFPSDNWRAGDLVLSRFNIVVPPGLSTGTYTLRAGMYSYPDINSIPVIDPGGNPIDDGLVLRSLQLTP